ncbi:MAG TPA: bifunctional molybdenum cofactor biosynthesis protein MoaC/MoaB [Candidatus Limnocylindrales bacterium]|nr:bifunctional molybdenum cofactor biosynthesis protein MoaC/MoaB [Candidatus Limnocylindrales bacterium]
MTERPSHLDAEGAPRMVDVGDKPVSARRAVAAATVRMRPDVLATLLDAGGPKGDALVTARLAGIGGAKRTAELIPLCHPLPLDRVDVELSPDRQAGTVRILAEARATARTGVEMEALTAASVAALTLYDMAKALQRDIVIERVELLEKEGGRSGSWSQVSGAVSPAEHEALVITCSNRSAAGEREDTSGPTLVAALAAAGWDVEPEAQVVADDEALIASALVRAADAGYRLVLTSGGTGLTPGDVTPAATRRVIDREVPGLAELMRAAGIASTPMAALSRGVVGARGATLIANLPGSPRGAAESLSAVLPVLRHAVEQLAGGDH